MRERLVELIESVRYWGANTSEEIADHLLANGVILPPCKVGDSVYQTDGVRIYESTVNEINIFQRNKIFCTEKVVFDENAIGTSVFLILEEAEKALKERSEI